MSAEDSLAVSLLVILVIAAVTLMTILYSLFKNAGKRDELEELLADDEEDRKEELAGGETETREPWEKDSDWWKE